jgi:hypothetical protein
MCNQIAVEMQQGRSLAEWNKLPSVGTITHIKCPEHVHLCEVIKSRVLSLAHAMRPRD